MTAAVRVESAGGFDDLPAGPELAAALEAVDPAVLVGEAATAWMRGAFRVRNHADWLLRAVREACGSRSGTTVRVEFDEFAPKIAAASLGRTATMAASRLHLAVGVLERMPALGEAMRAGTLEVTEASAFVTGLEGLSDEQARRVVDAVLPDAPSMGTSELRDRILDAAYAVDHVWGAARLAAATARARVSAETAPSGAVDLCGRDLDPNLAQHAQQRLRALALAIRARLRASGHKVGLGFIEARVFIRLMDGTQAGAADDTAVIDAVTAELATPRGGGPDAGGDPDAGNGPDGDDDHGGGPGSRGDDDPGPLGDDRSDPPDNGKHDDPAPHSPREATGPARGARCIPFAPEIGVRLALSTLLGLDDAPGLLPGLGPVPADTAREAARARGAAAWKVLVHDEPGHLHHLLTLRAPPDATRDPRFVRHTVQLAAPAALLHALDPTGTTAIAASALAGARPTVFDAATTAWLTRLRDALIHAETAPPDDHPATTTRERDRRFPSARLAGFVRARDLSCIAPFCTRPAEAWTSTTPSTGSTAAPPKAADLEVLCRHEHRGKHEGGWTYQQPEPGRFVITDPTGTRHHVHSRVVHPRPAPHTPGHANTPSPTDPPPREDWTPRRTRDGRITPKPRPPPSASPA